MRWRLIALCETTSVLACFALELANMRYPFLEFVGVLLAWLA
jgi:hypothetical protein